MGCKVREMVTRDRTLIKGENCGECHVSYHSCQQILPQDFEYVVCQLSSLPRLLGEHRLPIATDLIQGVGTNGFRPKTRFDRFLNRRTHF